MEDTAERSGLFAQALIGAVAAFFNLSNRMANLADMKPNREFYTMGRG